MQVIKSYNVNTAYPRGLRLLHDHGVMRKSRNGPVIVMPEPVTTTFMFPTQRVLFSAQRNANPFFHLFEALWMLTGSNDVSLPAYFVPRMANYSDDGTTFHGAYGFRWRRHFFELDQLNEIVRILHEEPDDRRCVLAMWDPSVDLGKRGKDFPCNVVAKFELDAKHTHLNMVVFNRSNDIIWGCYGANVVQFSVLQEYMAARLGVAVGWYEHVSSNFHAYLDSFDKAWPLKPAKGIDAYADPYHDIGGVENVPIVRSAEHFDKECQLAIDSVRSTKVLLPRVWINLFFPAVLDPMATAYALYRKQNTDMALAVLQQAILTHGRIDWLVAGEQWMQRIAKQRQTKDDIVNQQIAGRNPSGMFDP
jgi:hypothetical protein